MLGAYAVSTKEMKERTARLRLRDPVVLNKQKKETEERRKLARRDQQRNFSDVSQNTNENHNFTWELFLLNI